MKVKKEFTITKYKIDGMRYSFNDERQAINKYKEIRENLSSNEKLEVIMTDSVVMELDWSNK